jgi:hypothetical protein
MRDPSSPFLRDKALGFLPSLALLLALGCAGSTFDGAGLSVLTGPASVSGTVAYSGAHTGPIQVVLTQTGGGAQVLGTALAAPGAFTIRGVPQGHYRLTAYMDLVGNGAPGASDPGVASPVAVAVEAGAVTGLALTLVDPALDLAGSPGPSFTVHPMDSGALVSCTPLQATFPATGASADPALAYTVEWSQEAAFTTILGSRTFPPSYPGPDLVCLADPTLKDGDALFFRMRASGSGGSTGDALLGAPVTLGAPAGGIAVSGTATFQGTPTGPLFVTLRDAAGDWFGTSVAAPASPQAFTIAGVPAGIYTLAAFLDQNGNGVLDAGDPTNAAGWNPPIQVAEGLGPQDVALATAAASAEVVTTHSRVDGTGDDYQVGLTVSDLTRHVVSVTILSGPDGTVAPQDLGRTPTGFATSVDLGGMVPSLATGFSLQVAYADGTRATLKPVVTGVLADLPQDLSPAGAGSDLVPTFSWGAPLVPPATSFYRLAVWNAAVGTDWVTGWFPGALTSVAYGADPADPANGAAALHEGVAYSWELTLADGNGNQASETVTYIP